MGRNKKFDYRKKFKEFNDRQAATPDLTQEQFAEELKVDPKTLATHFAEIRRQRAKHREEKLRESLGIIGETALNKVRAGLDKVNIKDVKDLNAVADLGMAAADRLGMGPKQKVEHSSDPDSPGVPVVVYIPDNRRDTKSK